MSGKYVLPHFNEAFYTCPHCETLATQEPLLSGNCGAYVKYCAACGLVAVFVDDGTGQNTYPLVYPLASSAPRPNDDLSAPVRLIYEEARQVLPSSARAAAALLRLALQVMCVEASLPGKNINEDIQSLIDSKLLRPAITRAMDVVRITGNEAVHPGEINLNDDVALATKMFGLINVIASDLYTQAKDIQGILDQLPKGAVKAIDDRAAAAAKKAASQPQQ